MSGAKRMTAPEKPFRAIRCMLPGIHAVAATTRRTFSRHTHDQFGIGVIERGAHRSWSGRGFVEAKAGSTIPVNPGEVHDGAPIGDGERSWWILYLDPPLVADVVQDIAEGGRGEAEFSRTVMPEAGLALRARSLFASLTEPRERAPLQAQERLWLLLADSMRGAPSGAGIPTAIAKAKSRIDDDPAAPLSLQDLAEASGLSRFQVVRGFARAMGLTPHTYLVQRRVHRARHLIVEGNTLTEAALASGFADQSHMTRHFVRAYGITPGALAAALR
jgi:AraC-like DNA-binding protein